MERATVCATKGDYRRGRVQGGHGVREKWERKTTEKTQYENTMVKTNALSE